MHAFNKRLIQIIVTFIFINMFACNNQDTKLPDNNETIQINNPKDTIYYSSSGYAKIKHIIKISNNGNLPVKIISINPSCTCSHIDIADSIIQIQKSTSLSLNIDLEHFENEKSVHAVIKTNGSPSYHLVRVFIMRKPTVSKP